MIHTLVILGASGDLTSRFLMPAIVRLYQSKQLPEGFRIVGLARDDWDTEKFRHHLQEKMSKSASHAVPASRDAVLAIADYRRGDVTDRKELAGIIDTGAGPIVAYLALPPALFHPTVEALAALGLPGGSKVVLEKPFGENLESAQALNRLLHHSFPEQDVFRLDHFLGKQTVQNLLGLRFANRIFEPLWSFQHVERVEIIWDETLTAAGRASFYDATGALRDVIQNHLLQLLALIAMEPHQTLDERTLRDRKVDVLRAVHPLSPEEVVRQTLRGRYGRGGVSETVRWLLTSRKRVWIRIGTRKPSRRSRCSSTTGGGPAFRSCSARGKRWAALAAPSSFASGRCLTWRSERRLSRSRTS
jgi:glucose-6-phosphate 1-dehydrogenase